jgi:hypothetical protein
VSKLSLSPYPMTSNILPRPFALLVLLGICWVSVSADDISPRFADSSKAQRDRDLALIGKNPSAPAEFKAAVTRLRLLRDELRERVRGLDTRIRDTPESDPLFGKLKAEREKVLLHEKKIGALVEQLESAFESVIAKQAP